MKAERSEFEGSTEGKKIDEELFEAIENFDGDGEALLVDLLDLFRKHAKKENAVISEMYANAHAKLRDLEKEFSDMKANLHRAYKGLENHKSLKIELQKQKEEIQRFELERTEMYYKYEKQKELNAELVEGLKMSRDLMRTHVPSSQTGLYVEWIEARDIVESLIKKSKEL